MPSLFRELAPLKPWPAYSTSVVEYDPF
jgi:hypothetical protein